MNIHPTLEPDAAAMLAHVTHLFAHHQQVSDGKIELAWTDDRGALSNPDKRLLSTKKANYGRIGEEISLTWCSGMLVADRVPTGVEVIAGNAKAERVFLKLLSEFTEQGRRVNPNSGPNYAPKKFAEHPSAEGVTKRAFKSAMESLLHDRKISVEKEGPPSRPVTYLEVC